MNVLFVMWHPGFVRNYESVLRQLAARGHRVHIAAELVNRNKYREGAFGEQLMRESTAITMGQAAVPEPTFWAKALSASRLLVDYLRYLDPRFSGATALRARAGWVVPETLQPIVSLFDRLGHRPAAWMIGFLTRVERVAPLSRAITSFLDEQRPDVVLVTPLVEPGSIGVDYIKCARAAGIPTALCVASWDNLTNKGSMRVVPDRVFVWNAVQQQEAEELHGVPRERVEVTGAQLFDHWFLWQPSRTREEFCRTVGLDPAAPFVLYLGSSFFIAPDEAAFGARWIAALRNAPDPVVAGAGILIRPHPGSGRQWHGADFSMWPNTAIWPPSGVDWAEPRFKDDFFDSLFHCSAVMGVNTSAQIEAAIVGKAVCTVQAPDFEHSQGGTLHFRHLVDGGLLHVARTLDEHVEQLGAILRDPEAQAERSRRFVTSFVRPHGLDVAATDRLSAAILALGAAPRLRVAQPRGARLRVALPRGARLRVALPGGAPLARAVLAPLAWLVAWLPDRRPWWAYLFIRPLVWVALEAWFLPHRLGRLRKPAVHTVRKLRRAGRQAGRPAQDYLTRRAPRAFERAQKRARGFTREMVRPLLQLSVQTSRSARRIARIIARQARYLQKSMSRMAHRAVGMARRAVRLARRAVRLARRAVRSDTR